MSNSDYTYGEFKLWYGKEHGAVYSRWVHHEYRVKNSITEIREKRPANKSQVKWTVGQIPEGAEIIS